MKPNGPSAGATRPAPLGRRRPRPSGPASFTLVELLTVVAIMLLLLALLFPALRGAHEKAKSLACANNQRQIGVAIRAWTADHDGHFIGLGESGWSSNSVLSATGSLQWFNQLGRSGYIGRWVVIRRQHIDNRYSPNPSAHPMYRFPLLQCAAEPFWTESPWWQPEYYSGVPFNNYFNNYLGSSYNLNMCLIKITACKCSRAGSATWCSRTYCPRADDTCCAIGFSTLSVPGTSPANAILLTDGALYNAIGWHMGRMHGYDIGWRNDYGIATFDSSDSQILSITNNPQRMHAFHHPGGFANGLFYDGHVEPFRPMEFTPRERRISNSLWL